MFFYCADRPRKTISYIQEPSICIVLQGTREIYLGTEIYPQIIDDDTFHQAHLEQEKRGKHLRKPQKAKPVERKEIPIQFEMGAVIETYSDPFKQAQYAYSKVKEAE